MDRANHFFHILRLLETPGLGPTRINAAIESAAHSQASIEQVLGDDTFVANLMGPRSREAWLSAAETAERILVELHEKQIGLLAITDVGYPPRLRALLGRKAPPLLAVIGNSNLLSAGSVGFCGSREASSKGIDTARDCSAQLANAGFNVISGWARGVDMAAHVAALEAGGTTTVVLAEGILHFRIKREIAALWDLQRVAVISEFPPGLPWKVHNAMQRNRTICALSKAMILIEARSSGGSVAAGRTALEMGLPLFTPVYAGMPIEAEGNRELMQSGARSLFKRRAAGRANLTPLFAAVESARSTAGNLLEKSHMRGRKVEFDAHKTVKRQTEVEFTTSSGRKVDFVAKKPARVPVHVKFATEK